MDIRTGRTYESIDDARRDGVPEADIAFIDEDGNPHFAKGPAVARPVKVKFTKGSFKRVASK